MVIPYQDHPLESAYPILLPLHTAIDASAAEAHQHSHSSPAGASLASRRIDFHLLEVFCASWEMGRSRDSLSIPQQTLRPTCEVLGMAIRKTVRGEEDIISPECRKDIVCLTIPSGCVSRSISTCIFEKHFLCQLHSHSPTSAMVHIIVNVADLPGEASE